MSKVTTSFCQEHFSLGYTPGSGRAGSEEVRTVIFVRFCQASEIVRIDHLRVHSACRVRQPSSQPKRLRAPPGLPIPRGFHLHFPDGYWGWAPWHMLTGYLEPSFVSACSSLSLPTSFLGFASLISRSCQKRAHRKRLHRRLGAGPRSCLPGASSMVPEANVSIRSSASCSANQCLLL